jgi:hypothetical protein
LSAFLPSAAKTRLPLPNFTKNIKIEGQHVTINLFLTSITPLVLAVANPQGTRAKMEYLLRFIQTHETFRLPEIQALADLEGIPMEVVSYSLDVRAPHSPPRTHSLTLLSVPILYPQAP